MLTKIVKFNDIEKEKLDNIWLKVWSYKKANKIKYFSTALINLIELGLKDIEGKQNFNKLNDKEFKIKNLEDLNG